MKKKIVAALAAMMLLGTAMTAPASAETTYQKGDVDMDGYITRADVQVVLREYTGLIAGIDCTLTDEQIALATISGDTTKHYKTGKIYPFSCMDAQIILCYYLESLLVGKVPADCTIEDFYRGDYLK